MLSAAEKATFYKNRLLLSVYYVPLFFFFFFPHQLPQLLSQYDIILGFIVGVLHFLGTNGTLFDPALDAITSFGVSVA